MQQTTPVYLAGYVPTEDERDDVLYYNLESLACLSKDEVEALIERTYNTLPVGGILMCELPRELDGDAKSGEAKHFFVGAEVTALANKYGAQLHQHIRSGVFADNKTKLCHHSTFWFVKH